MGSRQEAGPLISFQAPGRSDDGVGTPPLLLKVELPPPGGPWEDIVAALRSAFGSRLEVSHVIAVDEDGDECSSAIDRGPLFWKTLKALMGKKATTAGAGDDDAGVVFKISGTFRPSEPLDQAIEGPSDSISALEFCDGDDDLVTSSVDVSDKALISEVAQALRKSPVKSDVGTPNFMYCMASYSGVEKELQLRPDSTWEDIVAALRSAFGSRLEVSHVIAVDEDGDECSSAIDRGPLFWKTMRALAHGALHDHPERTVRFQVYGDFGLIVHDKSFQSLAASSSSASAQLLRGKQSAIASTAPSNKLNLQRTATNRDLCAELWAACGTGSLEPVEAIIAEGVDVCAANSNGSQAIHFAAVAGSVPLLTFLLSKGADVNAKNYSHFTPLHFATDCCKVDATVFLLSRGADVYAETVEGYTPLMYICGRGTTGIFRTLQHWGVDINRANSQGLTCLHFLSLDAAANEVLVDELLELGADLECRDNELRTPLLLAAMSNNTKLACKFIARGAALNVWDSRHALCPLFCAVSCGNLELVVHLVLRGADMTIGDNFGNKLLHAAARKGNSSVVKFLIECGSPANSANRHGQRPVDIAAAFGHDSLLDVFTNARVFRTKDEMFFNACVEGNMELIDCMLGTGWDPIPLIIASSSPVLQAACAHGQVAVARRLVELGVPVDASPEQQQGEEEHGRTAFLASAAAGQLQCMIWLHATGANINAVDSNGNSALHLAARYGRQDAFEWLVAHGLDADKVNGDGLKAAELWSANSGEGADGGRGVQNEARDPALLALGVADLIVAPFFTALQSTRDMLLTTLPTLSISEDNVNLLSCLPTVSQIKDGLNLFVEDEFTKCVSDVKGSSDSTNSIAEDDGDSGVVDACFVSSEEQRGAEGAVTPRPGGASGRGWGPADAAGEEGPAVWTAADALAS